MAYAEAQTSADRAALQKIARDLRYWSQRQQSAEVMPEPAGTKTVQFGSSVTLLRSDGRRVTYRIVGEDEADPARGTVSYVSPLARALIGKAQGDSVKMGATDAEIERTASPRPRLWPTSRPSGPALVSCTTIRGRTMHPTAGAAR